MQIVDPESMVSIHCDWGFDLRFIYGGCVGPRDDEGGDDDPGMEKCILEGRKGAALADWEIVYSIYGVDETINAR